MWSPGETDLFAGNDVAFFCPSGVFFEAEFQREMDFSRVVGGVGCFDCEFAFGSGGEVEGGLLLFGGSFSVEKDCRKGIVL